MWLLTCIQFFGYTPFSMSPVTGVFATTTSIFLLLQFVQLLLLFQLLLLSLAEFPLEAAVLLSHGWHFARFVNSSQ